MYWTWTKDFLPPLDKYLTIHQNDGSENPYWLAKYVRDAEGDGYILTAFDGDDIVVIDIESVDCFLVLNSPEFQLF